MKFFAMMRDHASNAMSAFLVPNFVPNVAKTEFGLNPWYAGPNRIDQPIRPFPEQLALILREPLNIDILSIKYFYIASSTFVEAVQGIATNILQSTPVEVFDYEGNRQASKFYALRTKKVQRPTVLDMEKCKFSSEGARYFERLEVAANFPLDLFDVAGIAANQVTLICSERARKHLTSAGVGGVHYVPLEEYRPYGAEGQTRTLSPI